LGGVIKTDKNVQDLFSLTRKFSSDILSIDSKDAIWWHLANNIISKFGFEDLVIYELNIRKQALQQVAAFGNKSGGNKVVVNPIEIPIGKGVVGKCASTRKPVLVCDTEQCNDYIVDDEDRKSELAIPIIVNGEVFGVIDSESHQKNYYTGDHLKSLSVIAEICGIKIAQLQAVKDMEETIKKNIHTNRIQKTLLEISEIVYSSETIERFYKKLHKAIEKLTFSKNFYVAYLEEISNQIRFSYYVDEFDAVPQLVLCKGEGETPSLTEYALKEGKPVLYFEDNIVELIKTKKIIINGTIPKTWIGIPFKTNEKYGLVAVQSYDSGMILSDGEYQLLSFIAKHIQNAIGRKESSERLNFLALHDALTRLPNRTLFQEKIETSINMVNNHRSGGLALLYMDLDLFKDINDRYGHKVGDKVLIESAKRIQMCLRNTDTLCRLSGDEFSILLDGSSEKEVIERIAKSVIDSFNSTMKIDNHSIKLSISVGVATYENGDETPESLMVKADNALYQSKLKGRNQYTVHTFSSNNKNFPISRIECDFLDSLKNKELYCDYQPILDLKSKKILSSEVLIRWKHHCIGVIPPDQFIPILERSGLIVELDIYVLNTAIFHFDNIKDSLPDNFKFNINVSTEGFSDERFIDAIKKHLSNNQWLKNKICVEITEESLVTNVSVVKNHIDTLRGFGVEIALDDFGTGYSSLGYLDKFEFDYLKIDKCFIDEIVQSKKKKLILISIVNLAKSLGIRITAEGIENKEQLDIVRGVGCDYGQGFYIGRPNNKNALLGIIDEYVEKEKHER
jgi:diguanylate cyclase (GGDEF)-like protein